MNIFIAIMLVFAAAGLAPWMRCWEGAGADAEL